MRTRKTPITDTFHPLQLHFYIFFSAKIFQSQKCMICTRPLELPAVHFLCGDSFHQTWGFSCSFIILLLQPWLVSKQKQRFHLILPEIFRSKPQINVKSDLDYTSSTVPTKWERSRSRFLSCHSDTPQNFYEGFEVDLHNNTFLQRDYTFSACTEFFEKLVFFTPWYTLLCAYQGIRIVSFRKLLGTY